MARRTNRPAALAPVKYMISATERDSWESVSNCPNDIAAAQAMRFDSEAEGDEWLCLWSHNDDALGIFEIIPAS